MSEDPCYSDRDRVVMTTVTVTDVAVTPVTVTDVAVTPVTVTDVRRLLLQ